MKPDTSRWRSSSTYDYLDDLIPSDLAWEWLRRNAEYQRDYAEIERRPRAATQLTNLARLRWGVRFPCPPRFRCHRAACVLGAGSRSRHGHADGRATASWPRRHAAG
ncbi:transcriptional regulator domain-containing protein [Aurantimonas marina]|uniref:transcriptional regulator domain-containing protein n=1 Tax=Aurantimonas marina TaxID=2780508 RepID=UPI001E2A182F|nr:DUF6499 domain-containing protein [Aurantimonas marina]